MAKWAYTLFGFYAIYYVWVSFWLDLSLFSQLTSFRRARIASAIQEYHNKSCIRFVPRTDADLDYIHIVPEDGCYSMVGKTGKVVLDLKEIKFVV